MPVVVPSAPEVQETTRMLEDSESVSSWAISPARMSGCMCHGRGVYWSRWSSVLAQRCETDALVH